MALDQIPVTGPILIASIAGCVEGQWEEKEEEEAVDKKEEEEKEDDEEKEDGEEQEEEEVEEEENEEEEEELTFFPSWVVDVTQLCHCPWVFVTFRTTER
ncbi:unnamed protein product [Boreogadus saida]